MIPNDKLITIINKMIDSRVQGADKYMHMGSTWLIFTEQKQWVVELTKEKTLWYNYNFFKKIFQYFNLDVVENQHYITKWVEETIITGVNYTGSNTRESNWGSSKYEGTVYIIVDRLLVGLKDVDTWERMYGYDDIPDYTWDGFKEIIWEQVRKYFEADIDFDIEFNKKNINESVLNESILPEGMLDLLFDVVEDYKDSCDFFEDSLEYVESIIDYTIS